MTTILIAEDDPLVSSFLERGLRAHGYETMVVADGEQAEQLSLTGEFDLLILDLGLPRRNGIDVLRSLRGRDRRLPVLVVTGQPELGRSVHHLADDYMTKPLSFDELLARVRARLLPPPPGER